MALNPVPGILTRHASRLRFPRLLALTAGLFLFDLVVPDFVPFIDEILLGLGTLVLSQLRTRRGAEERTQDATVNQNKLK